MEFSNIKHSRLLMLLLGSMLLGGCMISSQKAFLKGSIAENNYRHEIGVFSSSRLIIIPVKIKGETYRFLFDTGAPNSISDKIQDKHGFKVISRNEIRDVDRNRRKVDYVKVDSLYIGDLLYLDQTSFVADYTANPVLKCLNIDGIVGSNLIRQSNWIIDKEALKVVITDGPLTSFGENVDKVSFKPNRQFSMKVNSEIGRAELSNLTIDYGSNSGLSLPTSVYNRVDEYGILDSIYTLIGKQQSGLFGSAIDFEKKVSMTDSLVIGDLQIPLIEVTEANSGLIGTEILLQYRVGIDWDRNLVLFDPIDEQKFEVSTFGIVFGVNEEKRPIVLGIMENGEAYTKGLRSNMVITEMNGESMEGEDSFCKFVALMNNVPSKLDLHLMDSTNVELKVSLDRQQFKSKK